MIDRLDEKTRKLIRCSQRNEITEHLVYQRLADLTKDDHNREVLRKISDEEKEHYYFWKGISGEEVEPSGLKIWWYCLISRILGITFGMKLMERGEEEAQSVYGKISEVVPETAQIIEDEDRHEQELIQMIDEERLKYVGSIVLGLSDALVELTGALAGFTFAFQDSRIIAMAGLITGIAASMSMGASEYLQARTEESEKKPVKASVYTASTYLVTVMILILPFLLLDDLYIALAWTILNAVIVILAFTYYISVVKEVSFKGRFLEMVTISLGIAGISFLIGSLVRLAFGIDV